MAPHSSTLAWQIPWTEEPGGLQSMGSRRVGLSDFTFTFHFHALEKEMATHSSVLAWTIPGTGEPGGLPSMGSHRVGHDWSNLAAAAAAWSIVIIMATIIRLIWKQLFCTPACSISKNFLDQLLTAQMIIAFAISFFTLYHSSTMVQLAKKVVIILLYLYTSYG